MSSKSLETRDLATQEYGFYDRLRAEFPSQIIVDATEICNLACIHCPHPSFKASEHYEARLLGPDLNAKMVAEVQQHGKGITQYIRYTSEGEPLTNRYIFEMLNYASCYSGVTVTLTTNGTLMDEKRIEKLLASGVNVIDISVDAHTPETYAKIRVNGNLNITRPNVLKLIQMAAQVENPPKIVVSYVEQPLNFHETQEFEQFWRDNGANYVVMRRLHSSAGALQQTADTLRQQAEPTARYPCLYPWERITLTPGGELAFCPQDWVHGSVVADYRTTTIHETWQSQFYQNLREAHLCNNFAQHQFCGQCPDWQGTRWPGVGRSYADMIEEFKDRE
ncbi:radical SAM protein [Neosynechococcus sphagnicola sy1]|uniref:Radical SAM protein n=1 Tax=Neosynechococcus sphagnicola sy1 TaxID=1497020 RepID=A0A098TI44_9CYAN|nr:radical SAM protein [Neosynechococcus sphagnicola]KGF71696.1 radical SAM protein [Neosynechococcus sphagnicola sy1]